MNSSDILIVGGGIAGLSAASALSRHAKVTVLEAEEAVIGCTLEHPAHDGLAAGAERHEPTRKRESLGVVQRGPAEHPVQVP